MIYSQTYSIDHMPTAILIGRESENDVREVRFDVSSWLSRWPDMIVHIIARAPESSIVYPVAMHMDGHCAVWEVRDSDTAVPGTGCVEVEGRCGEQRIVSASAEVVVLPRIPGTSGDAPEPAQPWINTVLGAAEQAGTAADNAATAAEAAAGSAETAAVEATAATTASTVANAAAGRAEAAADCATEAAGSATADAEASASSAASAIGAANRAEVAADRAEGAQAAAVQSVNGKTGAVELTAADVGALPDDTEIPATYTLPTASADTLGGVKVGEGLKMYGETLSINKSYLGSYFAKPSDIPAFAEGFSNEWDGEYRIIRAVQEFIPWDGSQLMPGAVYTANLSGEVIFELVSVDQMDTRFENRIRMIANVEEGTVINWGTFAFYNAAIPYISKGVWEFVWEFVPYMWVLGATRIGEVFTE